MIFFKSKYHKILGIMHTLYVHGAYLESDLLNVRKTKFLADNTHPSCKESIPEECEMGMEIAAATTPISIRAALSGSSARGLNTSGRISGQKTVCIIHMIILQY